jgi:hypothetical protein
MEKNEMMMTIESGHQPKRKTNMQISMGFDLEPLAYGNALIEFFGDDGKTFNTQIVTPSVVESMPFVASLTDIALREGPDAAKEIMAKLSDRQEKGVNDDE